MLPSRHIAYMTTKMDAESASLLAPVVSDIAYFLEVQRSFLSNDSGFERSFVADVRNWVQFQVSSLPGVAELGKDTTSHPTHNRYEILRLGLLIFSLIAVFPVPLVSAPFEELASRLLPFIETFQEESVARDRPGPLVWAMTMGALASIETRYRHLFVEEIASLCSALHIDTWSHFQTELMMALWDPAISDFDGQFLWLEVAEYQQRPLLRRTGPRMP